MLLCMLHVSPSKCTINASIRLHQYGTCWANEMCKIQANDHSSSIFFFLWKDAFAGNPWNAASFDRPQYHHAISLSHWSLLPSLSQRNIRPLDRSSRHRRRSHWFGFWSQFQREGSDWHFYLRQILKSLYRVTHHVVPNLLLTSKYMLPFSLCSL